MGRSIFVVVVVVQFENKLPSFFSLLLVGDVEILQLESPKRNTTAIFVVDEVLLIQASIQV